MRVLLVGSPLERALLRARLDGSMNVAGEFDSLAAARASEADSDAILMTPDASDVDEDEVDEPLTPREVQVLELLAEGLPNKAIAVRLHISDQTVKFHVSSISGKLGAKNRTDAVRRAVRRGLITL
jgi:two-component system nitrate/nitrite response regulator NarL